MVVEGDDGHPANTIRQLQVDVNGVSCSMLLQRFSDRILIVATESGKLGTMVSARRDVTLEGHSTYSTDVMLGDQGERSMNIELCARRIVEIVSEDLPDPPLVLLCVSLRDSSAFTTKAVQDVVRCVVENKVW